MHLRPLTASRAVLVLATTLVLVVGCGSTPEPASVTVLESTDSGAPVTLNVGGKPVVNAPEVLDAAEQAWRADIAEDGESALIDSDARCYLAATAAGTVHTQDASKEAAPVVCGPFGPENEWDAFILGPEVDQGTSVMLTPGEFRNTRDPNAPAGFTLQRPDGKRPAPDSGAPGVS